MTRRSLYIIDIFEDNQYSGFFESFASLKLNDMRMAFQKAPKDLIISIFGNKYKVNKLIMSDISSFAASFINNDPNLKEIPLDSYFEASYPEEKANDASENLILLDEVLKKVLDVINGARHKFDIRKEQKCLAKISRILCITLPSHLIINQKRDIYDNNQSFSGSIHEIELSSYSIYDFFVSCPTTFSLYFKDKEMQINPIILTLSDVLYDEFQKNPSLKTYTFDLDNSKDQLSPLIDFILIKSMVLTTNNIDIILQAAETMKIKPIIEIAHSLKKKFEESQILYDNEEEKVNFLVDLQDTLFNLSEDNFDQSLNDLIGSGWFSSLEDIKEFISNLCNAAMYRPKTRKLYVKLISQLKENELLEKLNNNDFFINFLVNHAISLSRESFLICPLIYELYEKAKLIDKKTLVRLIYKTIGSIENLTNKSIKKQERKFTPTYSLIWFLPEMEEEYPIIFDLIMYWDLNCVFSQVFSIVKLNIDDFRRDNWSLFKKNRDLMTNSDPFAIVIAKDDAEQLQIMSSKISFDFSTKIKMSLFENVEEISLIDYAARHGSINCFKYMMLNGANIRNSTYNYAIIGGSTEIIHIIDNEIGTSILTDVSNEDKIMSIDQQVATFFVPYGSYQMTNIMMSVMIRICNYYYPIFVQLENVLISCIAYHRDEVFEWLMNKYLVDGKFLALALCSLASIAYNNMKNFMLIVDSGLFIYTDFKHFDNLLKIIIQKAAENGFSEIIAMAVALYGEELINYSSIQNAQYLRYGHYGNINCMYGNTMDMTGKTVFSQAAAFGSIKVVNKFRESFNSISSNSLIYAISNSIYHGNFDFAEFVLNLQLFSQEQETEKSLTHELNKNNNETNNNNNNNDNDDSNNSNNNNDNDDTRIVKRNNIEISKLVINEWFLNAAKSCNRNNVTFIDNLISNLKIYFEKNGKQIDDYINNDLISSVLLTSTVYNDTHFFAYIVNHFTNHITSDMIEDCMMQACSYGYLTIINYCLTTLSHLNSEKKGEIVIDLDRPNYNKEHEVHISQKSCKKSMQNAAKYGHHDIILFFIEKIPSLFGQFTNDSFKTALSSRRSLTCRSLLSNMSFQPTPELLVLSMKSNLIEVVSKILEINHSIEFLNSINEEGSCLSIASSVSSIEIVQFLLNNYSEKIDPNIRDMNGNTALICAALHQRLDVIRLLCEKFQNRLDPWQFNALVPAFFSVSSTNRALRKSNDEISTDENFFDFFNPQQNDRKIESSSSNGIGLCYFLLNMFPAQASSSSSSIQSSTTSTDLDDSNYGDFGLDWNFLYNDKTALMVASEKNNLSLLQFLIGLDEVDVNARNVKDGDTALLIAAQNDNELIVEALVNHKKTLIGIENKHGESVLTKSIIPIGMKVGYNQNNNRSTTVINKVISSPNFVTQISQEQIGEALICAMFAQNMAIFNTLMRIPSINVMHTAKVIPYSSTNNMQITELNNWRDDSISLAAYLSYENNDFLDPLLNHNTFDPSKCNLQMAALLSTNKDLNTIFQPILNLLAGNVNIVHPRYGISLLNIAILSCSTAITPLVLTSPNLDKEKSGIDNAISWDMTMSNENNLIINTKFGPPQNHAPNFGRIQFNMHRNVENQNNQNGDDQNDGKNSENENKKNEDDSKNTNNNENNNNNNDNENNNDNNDNENNNDDDKNNGGGGDDEDEINKNLCIKLYNNIMIPTSNGSFSLFLETRTDEYFMGAGNVLKLSLNSRLTFENLLEYQDRLDPNKVDQFGNNDFTYATFISPLTVDALQRMKNADINQQNPMNGMTALMYACIFSPESIQTLLENEKIDVNIKDFEGKTAFDYLVDRYDLDIEDDFEQPTTREEFKDWIDQIQDYLASRIFKNPNHQWNY